MIQKEKSFEIFEKENNPFLYKNISVSQKKSITNRIIFVRNIKNSVINEKLLNHFHKFASFQKVWIKNDENNNSNKIFYILFDEIAEAEKLLKKKFKGENYYIDFEKNEKEYLLKLENEKIEEKEIKNVKKIKKRSKKDRVNVKYAKTFVDKNIEQYDLEDIEFKNEITLAPRIIRKKIKKIGKNKQLNNMEKLKINLKEKEKFYVKNKKRIFNNVNELEKRKERRKKIQKMNQNKSKMFHRKLTENFTEKKNKK